MEDELFKNSVAAIGSDDTEGIAYLGDPGCVDAILRSAAADWFNGGDVSELTTIPANVAKEFLGNGTCKGVPGWNEPGKIDVWLKKTLNLENATTPEECIGSTFLEMIDELGVVFDFAGQDGVLPEQWEGEADFIADRYRMLFMGVDDSIARMARPAASNDYNYSTEEPKDGEGASKKKRKWTKTQEALFKTWRDYP